MTKEAETGGTMSSFTAPAEEVTMSADYSNINAEVESSKVITFSEIAKTGKTVTAKKTFSSLIILSSSCDQFFNFGLKHISMDKIQITPERIANNKVIPPSLNLFLAEKFKNK